MRILVLGAGLSGKSAANFLEKKGVEVFLYDDRFNRAVPDKVDLVVKSPGVPPTHPLIESFKRKGTEVIGEVELAFRFFKGKIIAVTGTNGKSTTTALIHSVLKSAGYNSFIGGNYGIPFTSFVDETDESSVAVLELSSFQIDDLKSFKADIGIILNVTPDHLDRYSSFEDYLNSKLRLAKISKKVVLNYDDPNLKTLTWKNAFFFSSQERKDAYFDGSRILIRGREVPVKELPLKGMHNAENYMAAFLSLSLFGLSFEEIIEGAKTFKGLPHRMELVGEVKGVKFVNDSKSTNVDSLKKALLSFNRVILIAGGVDKGLDFSPLLPLVKEKVKALVLIGEASKKLKTLFSSVTYVKLASSMEEAVSCAFNLAKRGDVVLLSPGCASFDMFKNFEQRGEVFKNCVKNLEALVEKN